MNIFEEKIETEYDGDFNQVFDIGRFIILCEKEGILEAVVNVVKRAPEFNMTVSEHEDYFKKQSNTHYKIHNIKFYL